MRSSLGIMAVFVLAALGAFALALAHNAYALSSTDDAVVSASSRDTYTGYVLGGATGYLGDLPLGESQFLTIKSLVVIPDIDHASTIAPDGTGFNVSSSIQPGDSYEIYIAVHNASEVHQSAELTVEAPGSVTVDVQSTMGNAVAPDVIQTGPDRWTIIHSGQPQLGGPFDLTITVYSSKFMSKVDGRLRFELKAAEYVAQRPQLAGLVY